jgi:iron complex outermembrane receptor protein
MYNDKSNNMKNKYLLLLSSTFCLSTGLFAQHSVDTSSVKTFELGEVVVVGSTVANSQSEIKSQDLEKFQKSSISTSLNLLPGVSVSEVGGRNEAMVYIRGYDLRQVPVFIDGMPVYVPYDGYIDLARLQPGGISKISVSKGFSSMLYGANSMGGAINIISAKPESKIEVFGNTGSYFSAQGLNGYNTSLNLGTKQDKWYASANLNLLKRNFISLASGFDTLHNQTSHKLNNSFAKDFQYQFMAGYEPKAGQEYVLSYSGVRSDKGVPIYLGANPTNPIRYWQYPNWDKDCYYFHSKTAFTDKIILKTRLFYDKYYNVLKSFDNNTYTTQKNKSAFTSIYDDHTYGGAAELGLYTIANNEIKLGVNSKYDNHIEYNQGQKPRNFKDNTVVYALEDSWKVLPKLTLAGGIGYYARYGIRADDYNSTKDSVYTFPKSDDHSINYQGGVFFEPIKQQNLYLTVARKSRFATMKDRYSYRFGTAIPNPYLHSEQAVNTEVGYIGNLKSVQLSFAGFYNFIDNTIQQVTNVQPGVFQLQNTGKAEFRGIEGAFGWNVYSIFSIGSSYTLIDKQNISNPSIKFIDVPKHKVISYIKAEKGNLFYVMLDAEYNSQRISTSDGKYKVPACTLFNLNAEYYPIKYASVKVGIHNIFDKLYSVTEGYPEEGRTIYVSLTYKFSK